MAANASATSAPPFVSSTFSFTAPFPPSPAASTSQAVKPQRRVSLALPSSPRVFPAWTFRDDTGLGVHSADADVPNTPEKRGKMRRIASDEPEPGAGETSVGAAALDKPEMKPRKKWTMEETQMLVAGCNKVRRAALCACVGGTDSVGGRTVGCRELEVYTE